jgi:hypothetical protein
MGRGKPHLVEFGYVGDRNKKYVQISAVINFGKISVGR